jgi:ribonuclease III
MESDEKIAIEAKLAYTFENPSLLDEALCHSSYVNEQADAGIRDNERLEFLGDAVLNLVVGHLLMDRYPRLEEGELSRMRSTLVNESRLAKISRSLRLGEHIRLGKGEIHTQGRHKKSILADAFEALTAAVYLDGGFDAAFRFIDTLFSAQMDTVATKKADQDYKSRLQERVQLSYGKIPSYSILAESGPDHDKTFHVRLTVHGLTAEGQGKSKKAAEQDAAKNALEGLDTLEDA